MVLLELSLKAHSAADSDSGSSYKSMTPTQEHPNPRSGGPGLNDKSTGAMDVDEPEVQPSSSKAKGKERAHGERPSMPTTVSPLSFAESLIIPLDISFSVCNASKRQ